MPVRSPSIRPCSSTDMDIVGQPAVELDFSVDKPVAFVAVRLNDVWPTGEVARITYHVQNLCMRDSREIPEAARARQALPHEDQARRHRLAHSQGPHLRVSISTTYWPLMWPAPEPVTLTVYTGKSIVHVPVRKRDRQ